MNHVDIMMEGNLKFLHSHRYNSMYLKDLNRYYRNEFGTLGFLIFLFKFVKKYDYLPDTKDDPDFVAEVLAETSVDITDKAAILDLEKLIR